MFCKRSTKRCTTKVLLPKPSFIILKLIVINNNRNILEVLACVDDFRFYAPGERPAIVVFSLLFRILIYFPSLLDPVYSFLLHTLRARPRFLVNLIRLINALSAHAHGNAGIAHGSAGLASNHAGGLVLRMLQRFEEVLCSLPPRKLESYLALAERIVMEPLIDPTVRL